MTELPVNRRVVLKFISGSTTVLLSEYAAGETETEVTPWEQTVYTDKNGNYEIQLSEGVYQATVITSGFETKTKEVTVEKNESKVLNFTLPSNEDFTTRTDLTGDFEVNLPAGTYEVTAAKSGYPPETTEVTVEKNTTQTVDFTLSGTGTVTGQVTDEAGDSLADATVEFVPTGADTPEQTTTTNDSGNYEVELPADTTYEVTASKSGYVSETAEVTVEQNTTQTVNFTLNAEQPPNLNLEASTALPQGVVPGGVEKISLSVTNTESSSLTDIAFGLDPESLPDGWGVDDHIEGAGDSPNYKKILNSWDDSTATWTIDELGSGETLSTAVTVETTDSAPAGTQQSITARTGVDSPDDITTDVTVSLVTRFDPSVHGFGFANWASGDNTYPAHDHSSIALDEFSQLITESFIPDLQDGDVQIPGYTAPLLVSLLYPVINSGAATNGHCYGMVYASQEYYKSGVPVTGVSTANEILTPGVEDDAVGDDIDFYQNTQYLDTDVLTPILLLCVFDKSPDHYGAVLDDIQNTIEDQGTAPLALSTSGKGGGHSVLAYDVTDSAAGQTEVHVYDPSSPFDLDKASSVHQEYDLWAKRFSVNNPSGILDVRYTTSITFDTTGTDTTIESSYREYDQILPLKDGGDVDNPIQTFGKYVTGSLFALIADFLAGLVTFEITLSSPDEEATTGSTQESSPSAEVTVTDPSGDSLFALEAESGVDRSDLEFDAFRYQTAADPGQYGVTIDAEDLVEYTIQAKGEIKDAGSIEATESGTVAPEEGQAFLKATVPEDPEESGSITPGVPSLPGYENSPQDLDGDGLFEDVDGDGEFTIFDVQAFFTNFQGETVQSNPAAFNFTEEDPEEVTIFDVQALFRKLS